MKLKTITTYVLVCLLTRGNWNLVLPAKGDGDGNELASSAEATPANGSAEATSEDSTSKADGLASVESSEATPANGSSNGSSNGSTANGSSEATPANGSANGSGSPAPELKLFKDDGNGNPVEMEAADYEKKNVSGGDKYTFKNNTKCVSVKFGDKEVWKKDDQSVTEPKSVTFKTAMKIIIVEDASKSVKYKKSPGKDTWSHFGTTQKSAQAKSSSTDTSGSSEGAKETNEASAIPSSDADKANEPSDPSEASPVAVVE